MTRSKKTKKQRATVRQLPKNASTLSILKAILAGEVSYLATPNGTGWEPDAQKSAAALSASSKKRSLPDLTPDELREDWEEVADKVAQLHSLTVRKAAERKSPVYSIVRFDPMRSVEALVGTSAVNQRRVVFSIDLVEYAYDTTCTCGKNLCVHSYHLSRIVKNELLDETSTIFRGIFGDDHAERKRLRELAEAEKERKQKQQKLLSMLQRASSISRIAPTELDQTHVAEPERVQWNLNASTESGRSIVELKALRQKENKSGTWAKGRDSNLKNFMEMPRDGWSRTDWAIAEQVEILRWNPYFRLAFDAAFRILEGTDVFQLNRQPATLKIVPFELVVTEVDGGWVLTTPSRRIQREWTENGGQPDSFATQEGHLVVSTVFASVVWIKTPPELLDLVRFVTMETAFFSLDQRDVLLSKLNELQGRVPLQLPPSLGGEEVPENTESLLLLRLKKTGALEATVCVRDSRELLMLPGDGLLRRQETVDGLAVQRIRDAVAERKRARKVVQALSLDRYRNMRDWVWQIEDPDEVVDLLSAAGELAGSEHQTSGDQLKLVWHQNSARQLNIIGSVSTANVSVKVARQRDWFGVNGTCKIGDQEIPLQDVLAGLRGATRMDGFIEVQPGQWASIAEEFRATLQRLADVSNDNRGKLQLDASAAMALSAIDEQTLNIEADKAWKSCLSKVRSIKTINPDPPVSLNCDLREYQVEGFRWMCRLSEWGVGGILADDMGLGKTVQTLAVLLQRMETGPSLVIAPTSLGFNWEQECRKLAPSLTPRLLREADRTDLITNATDGDLIICSYGLALRETELLQSVKWGTLVLDEAQNIKNSNAKTSKEIRKLNADWKVALTGTPMENHLGELWSIFRAVSPGVLGSWEQFRKKFALPIEKDNDNERRSALSQVISPFILRRSKKEVLTDLPERSESNLLIELTPEERKRYDQVRLAAVGELDSLGDEELSSDQRFKVLQLLTRLRQIACHVGLVDETWKNGSSKLTMLLERLEQLKERGSRPLIFSQFTSHLALIKEACDHAGITYQYLDGQTTPKARQQRVEAFQNGEGDAFLISLKAGGTGLNLTAADYVIHMDPWWNPAVEDQATDRAHRIGQQNSVMVYRIIAKDTIEEQILSLHSEKRDLVEGVLSGAEASAKLTTEQLAELIRSGVRAKV